MSRFSENATSALSRAHRPGHVKSNRSYGQNPGVMFSWMNARHDWLDGTVRGPTAAEIAEKKRERRRIDRELLDDENAQFY